MLFTYFGSKVSYRQNSTLGEIIFPGRGKMNRDYRTIRARSEVVDNCGRKYSGHVTFSKKNKRWRGPFSLYSKENGVLPPHLLVYTWVDPETKKLICRIRQPNTGSGGEVTIQVAQPPLKKKRRGNNKGWKIRVYRLQQPLK